MEGVLATRRVNLLSIDSNLDFLCEHPQHESVNLRYAEGDGLCVWCGVVAEWLCDGMAPPKKLGSSPAHASSDNKPSSVESLVIRTVKLQLTDKV